MTASVEERVGILILRAWLDPGAEPRLRVRITHTLDIDRHEPTVEAAAMVEDACDVVRAWLTEFLATD
jgi:hypothetical protein